MENLGTRIKKLRENAGYNQKELAQKLQISNTTLSQYENGDRTPSDEIKVKLANIFKVTIDYLITGSESQGAMKSIDDDIRMIQRARTQMNADQKERMIGMLKMAFPDFFEE